MAIVIFVLVLVALIVVHEFGHFVVAKLSGMRVDEFGIGYPPRAYVFAKKGGTEYTLNWLPFGGFVRIYGEDAEQQVHDKDHSKAFSRRPRYQQILVLLAGIVMNLAFAWVLLSVSLAIGTPRALTASELNTAHKLALTAAQVLPGSPAAKGGLHAGDAILHASTPHGFYDASEQGFNADSFTAFIAGDTDGAPIALSLKRGGHVVYVTVTPSKGIIPEDPERYALGLAIVETGVIAVPVWSAPWEGLKLTAEITKETAVGLATFFGSIFTFTADLAQVSGPVGIAGAVGDASSEGLTALLSITAIISINLALINVLPIPALDGGRLLFVIIEGIIRRPIRPSIAQAVNTLGFGLLILLMLVVTAHDVFKIFM